MLMEVNMEKYYTISEVADMLQVSTQTLRRWDNNGKFKSTRHPINNYRVYTEKQITEIVNELEPEYSLDLRPSKETYTPFFKTDKGELYNIDAVTLLRTLPPESIDLVFADPPYNIKKAQWDSFESQKAYIEWSLQWIKEIHRVLKRTGSLYVCGFSEILADIKWSASYLFTGCKWLIWYYRNKANLSNDWGRSHESILHFRKSREFIFNLDQVRVPYNRHTLKYPRHPQAKTSQYGNGKEYTWSPHPNGAKPKDVFEIPTISNHSWEKYNHPTQKPVELLKKVIFASSNENDIVLDPFGGSGTTFAVAEAFNRKWIGIESELEYCEIIKRRLLDNDHINRIYLGKDDIESQSRRVKLRG